MKNDSSLTKEEVFNIVNGYIQSPDTYEKTQKEVLKILFKYYKENGYPNYDKNSYDSEKEYKKILEINENDYYDETTKTLKKYQAFNGFMFSYFPHWFKIPCGISESLSNSWKNDKTLRTFLEKNLTWILRNNERAKTNPKKTKEKWTDNRLRQNAKVFCSKQTVSNFNPITAKWLYNTYGNQGAILDMSCGWGGRLFGFLGSNCKTYYGFEPSNRTFNCLKEFSKSFNVVKNKEKKVKLYKQGCETMDLKDNSIDFAFTSPPYFDCEKYSNEKTQSYIKFNTKETWSEGFLGETFKRVYKCLKNNCYMAINIKNTPKHDWLESACVEQAEKAGFKLVDKLFYELSGISGNGNKNEPIFIFKKEE